MKMVERAARAAIQDLGMNPDDSSGQGDELRWQTELPTARAALIAALDPHDSELQSVILGAMGFFAAGGDFSPMARVQAHDAIAALRDNLQKEKAE